MTDTENIFVFGPVPSRRLGRSLGVDLVPFKTCSYDCIYCQLGRTTTRTIKRKRYAPVAEILDQLWEKLDGVPQPNYITLSGSGEPTLHSHVDEIIEAIKKRTRIPVSVITNGSLLWDKEVQEALVKADLVMPSLDAGDSTVFEYINRPHPEIKFERMADGLAEFRQVFPGKIWLEVFLVADANSMPSQVLKIVEYVDDIKPDKVQLNTVVRPPTEAFAHTVPYSEMRTIKLLFGEIAEIIAPYENKTSTSEMAATTEAILATLQRRPCTLEDIAKGLGIHRNEASKHISILKEQNLLQEVRMKQRSYYRAVSDVSRKVSL